jgi:hypothetical protein
MLGKKYICKKTGEFYIVIEITQPHEFVDHRFWGHSIAYPDEAVITLLGPFGWKTQVADSVLKTNYIESNDITNILYGRSNVNI